MGVRIVIGTLALAVSTHMASAAGLGLYASYWDADEATDEVGFGAKLQIPGSGQLSYEVRGGMFNFEEENDALGLSASLDAVPIEAGIVVKLGGSDSFSPYIGGGGGYYVFSDLEFSDGVITESYDTDPGIGFYGVAGIEISLAGNMTLFAEAKYTSVEFDASDVIVAGNDVTYDMSGMGANAGLLIKW